MSRSTDEDWSIISSSSDVDDDQSTTSSHDLTLDHQNDPLDLAENRKEPRSSISSFTTFKLPSIYSRSNSSGSKNDAETVIEPETTNDGFQKGDSIDTGIDAGLMGETNSLYAASVSSLSEETNSDSESEQDLCDPEKLAESAISSKINFYENLSKINESIKQSSTNFYSNFAKVKIDQLNKYIADQRAQTVKEEPQELVQEEQENLDDTIVELRTVEETVPTTPLPVDPVDKEHQIQEEQRVFQKYLLQGLAYLQKFLESNSDYLYYYFFASVLSLIPLYYVSCYVTTYFVAEQDPENAIDYMRHMLQELEELMYEEETASISAFSFFSKKKKRVNKIVKYGNRFKNNVFQGSNYVIDNYLHIDRRQVSEVVMAQWNGIRDRSIIISHELVKFGKLTQGQVQVLQGMITNGFFRYKQLGLQTWDLWKADGLSAFNRFLTTGMAKFREFAEITNYQLSSLSDSLYHFLTDDSNKYSQQVLDSWLWIQKASSESYSSFLNVVDSTYNKYDGPVKAAFVSTIETIKANSIAGIDNLNDASLWVVDRIKNVEVKQNLNRCAVAIYKRARPLRDLFKGTTTDVVVVPVYGLVVAPLYGTRE